MNLILFDPAEIRAPLPRADRRAVHILEVLRRKIGETVDVGLINGPLGKATVTAIDAAALTLAFAWGAAPPPLAPITLLVGLPRPQTARDILRDATTLGVAAIHFVATEKSEASYAQSTLWSSGEWRRHAIAGAEQAFDTRVPEISHGRALAELLPALPSAAARLALDNYEAPMALGRFHFTREAPVWLAIGAERGWSAREREQLRENKFSFVHLGARVLRTETAVTAAIAIVRLQLGLL